MGEIVFHVLVGVFAVWLVYYVGYLHGNERGRAMVRDEWIKYLRAYYKQE